MELSMERKRLNFYLSQIIAKAVNKYGNGHHATLEKYIEDQNKGLLVRKGKDSSRGTKKLLFSRKAIARILDPEDKEAPFDQLMLEALEQILNDDESLTNNPIFIHDGQRVCDIFYRETKLDLLIPTVFNKEFHAQTAIRWHLRVLEQFQNSNDMNHLKIRFRDVIFRPFTELDDRNKLLKRQWYKRLNPEGKSDCPKISVGGPLINIATEVILSQIFKTEPYTGAKNLDSESSQLPVYLHFPSEDKERFGKNRSSFHMSKEELVKHRGFSQIKQQYLQNPGRCFILGDKIYMAQQENELKEINDKLTTYGVFAISRCAPFDQNNINGRLIATIMGTETIDNYALAHRIFNTSLPIKATLPPYDPEANPEALIIVVKNTSQIREDIKQEYQTIEEFNKAKEAGQIEEWREISTIELISINRWTYDNNQWKISKQFTIDKNEKTYRKK